MTVDHEPPEDGTRTADAGRALVRRAPSGQKRVEFPDRLLGPRGVREQDAVLALDPIARTDSPPTVHT